MADVEVVVEGPIRTIRLNRPEKRNALTRPMLAVMEQALPTEPPPEERVAVITAEGRVFSAGFDLAGVAWEVAEGHTLALEVSSTSNDHSSSRAPSVAHVAVDVSLPTCTRPARWLPSC